MASPNVEFYQRQKDLQDQMSKSERERMQLEKQFTLLMQSDQNSSQLKASKLHTYWKKICADEQRAQQRNAMLVREFERIDSHLSAMTARTQRLHFLKQQYADYVARTYPQWTRTVEQKMRGEPQQDQQTGHSRDTSGVRRSQEWTEAEREDSTRRTHQQQQQQHQQQHQQHYQPQQHPQQYQSRQLQQGVAQPYRDESSAADDSSGARAPMSQPIQRVSVQRVPPSVNRGDVTDFGAGKPAMTPSGAAKTSVRDTGPPQLPQKQALSSAKQPEIQNVDLDSPKSEYMNISQFSNKNAIGPHSGRGDQPSRSPMDAEDSDFGTDNDLPLSDGDASPVKAPSLREEGVRSRQDSVRSLRSSGSLLPELTVDGLIRLLHHIEVDISSGKQGVEYYGTPILNVDEKIDFIQRANAGGALQGVSGMTASHLVLEQMSHVVRNLPEECLIGEQLLTQSRANITVSSIANSLTGEAKKLWTAVFTHFTRLHEASVMEVKEIAGVFVPCLVADRSPYLDKAFTLLANLLEGDDATDASSIVSPRQQASHLGNSNSLMEDGRVPPLKFGSLVDKPLSDEESSFFDQSMPKEPAVPLNETSAYKQMLSGTFSRSQQRAPVTSDDTDDDVEKEFANVLSPKTVPAKQPSPKVVPQPTSDPESPSDAEPSLPGPKSPVYVPTAMDQKSVFGSTASSQAQRRTGLRLGSDFETDSEMEPAILGSSKKPAAEEDKDDFDFYD